MLVFAAEEIRSFYFFLFFLTGLIFFFVSLSVFVLSILYYLVLVFMFNAFNKVY